jgi:hypothetical protein
MGKAWGTILMLGALALPVHASAQTVNFGDAAQAWADNCKADVAKACKGIRPGQQGFLACLEQKASPQCQSATAQFLANMNARFEAQKAAPGICRSSIQRFCSNFKAGSARILRCLVRPNTFKEIDIPCQKAITNAGWLEHIATPQ